jgi:hypothetical protein
MSYGENFEKEEFVAAEEKSVRILIRAPVLRTLHARTGHPNAEHRAAGLKK